MRVCLCFTFHLSPRLCPSTAGCSPPSMSPIVLCLLLYCFRWFPPSFLCHLAIFCIVVLLISSLSLVAALCSVWSTYCPSFLLYVQPISTFVSVCILEMTTVFVCFLISERGILSCMLVLLCLILECSHHLGIQRAVHQYSKSPPGLPAWPLGAVFHQRCHGSTLSW